MNDGTTPTDPVVMPDNDAAAPADDGMGAPVVTPPVVPASDGGMGDDAPVAEPAAPVEGGAVPAEGEEKPEDDAPAAV